VTNILVNALYHRFVGHLTGRSGDRRRRHPGSGATAARLRGVPAYRRASRSTDGNVFIADAGTTVGASIRTAITTVAAPAAGFAGDGGRPPRRAVRRAWP
jgi:hypothetical protein